MGNRMNSRERVMRALRGEPTDYVPCVLLNEIMDEPYRRSGRCQFPWGPSMWEEAEYCVNELGIDPVFKFELGGFTPGVVSAEVSSKTWVEDSVIHKVFTTPAGQLKASVKYNDLWPHGLDIPFYSDHNIAHFIEPWLETEQDLECLKHIIVPPDKDQIDRLRFDYTEARKAADHFGIAVFGQVGLGLTGMMHLCGPEKLCLLTVENPQLVDAYLEFEHQLNLKRLQLAMDFGVDIIKRNGFYECTDFFSPSTLSKFLETRLAKEIETVHQAGKVICYCINSGVMAQLDYLQRLDFDCLMQLELASQDVDLVKLRDSQKGKKSFWTGPSDTYQVGQGPAVVKEATREIMDVFADRLLLTVAPSTTALTPWQDVMAMIQTWKERR